MKVIDAQNDFDKFVDYFSHFLNYLKFYDNKKLFIIHRKINFVIIIFMSLSNVSLILSEVAELKNSHDLSSFATTINPVFFHLLGSVKFFDSILKIGDIENLLSRMRRCHQICLRININISTEQHQYEKKLLKFTEIIKNFFYIWISFCAGGMVQWCLNPIIRNYFILRQSGDKIEIKSFTALPYVAAFPWSINSFTRYSFTVIFQLISGVLNAFELSVCDVFTIMFLANACFYLQYLNEHLENDLAFIKNYSGLKELRENMKNYIMLHTEILNFIQKINETFDYPLFIQCVTSTIGLCLVSLEASTIQLNSSVNCIMKMINMLEYWIGITSSLFIYCYLGTTIRELGLRVADAIYLSNWNQLIYDDTYSKYHNQPTSNQIKYIIRTVLMRSQQPIIINGGLFYILSLQTFKALVGCSLSNAIILRELSEDD